MVYRPAEFKSSFDVIKWWELRRVPYNAIVGATGVVTCAIVLAVAGIAEAKFNEPLGLPDPPIFAFFGIILYGLAGQFLLYRRLGD